MVVELAIRNRPRHRAKEAFGALIMAVGLAAAGQGCADSPRGRGATVDPGQVAGPRHPSVTLSKVAVLSPAPAEIVAEAQVKHIVLGPPRAVLRFRLKSGPLRRPPQFGDRPPSPTAGRAVRTTITTTPRAVFHFVPAGRYTVEVYLVGRPHGQLLGYDLVGATVVRKRK